jgi:sugar phosphate isomerase/epimerase
MTPPSRSLRASRAGSLELGVRIGEVAVFVACSTMCFGNLPLVDALRSIGEIGFTKVDLALRESGPHLRPADVVSDLGRAVQSIRSAGGLTVAAIHVDLPANEPRPAATEMMRAVCRLARVLTTPLISIPAAAGDADVAAEIQRLTWLNRLAQADGVTLTLETRTGTLTDNPATAIELCRSVPGLGLALDPSHYLIGPYHSQQLDDLFPFVQHVRLRDTNGRTNQFQVRIGQGEIEYGRIVNQLARYGYQRTLSVDLHDSGDAPFPMQPEVRKLKYLLESLI